MSRSSSLQARRLVVLGLLVGLVSGCRGDLQAPLLVISGPTGYESFQIGTEDGEVLWAIAADEPTTLTRIDYGLVPDGFRQLTPGNNEPPRALIPGEWLISESVSSEGVFHHEGVAVGPGSFQPMHSRMVLNPGDSRSPE